jgi:hypothetical protein
MPKVIPKPTLILSLILLTTALGCGDAGPPGAMGEEGPQGKPGPEGEPGTANVIYSEWFSLDEASDKFTYSIISGTTGSSGTPSMRPPSQPTSSIAGPSNSTSAPPDRRDASRAYSK